MSFGLSSLIARRSVVSRGASARALFRFTLFAFALTAAFAASYWVPALRATGGDFPAPLDDVYIHFDFARAAARGHPFAWIAGQGYSSGETAPAYAAVLAVGWALGFRGMSLGWFAAAVAVVTLTFALRSLARVFAESSWALVAATATLLFACGHVAFGIFSGMELALHTLFLVRALEATAACEASSTGARARREWALGGWGALLVWTRPESVVIVLPFALVAARARTTRWPWGSLVRAGAPAALATLVIAALNRAFTGEWQSAGALLKLLSSNPFLSDTDRARELVLNVLHFVWKVLEGSLVATPALVLFLAFLVCVGIADRRLRDRTVALLASSVLYALLVSWNGAARYQNFRYYVPAVLLFLLAVAHGAAAIERRGGRGPARAVGALLVAVCAASALSRAGLQRTFFRRAAANIHGQQVQTGLVLRTKMGQSERVLVGDAGAIPYLSDRGAIDALGLGGYERLPFARAATVGEAATVELLQRVPPPERPAWLALYPNWFSEITTRFGTEVTRVTIDDNVICGGPSKVVYRADWRALDGDVPPEGTVLDELDVADPISEREHHYVAPAPRGGFPAIAVRRTAHGDVFDGGRTMPPGTEESFVLHQGEAATLVLRSDSAIDAVVETGDGELALHQDGAPGDWVVASVRLASVPPRLTLRARGAPLRDFHVWLVR